MSEIKTRENVKGIKTLEKTVNLGQRMKTSLIKSKDQLQSVEEQPTSAEDYASTEVELIESKVADGVRSVARKGRETVKKQNSPDYQRPMREQAKKTLQDKKPTKSNPTGNAIKQKSVNKSVKSTANRTVKASGRTIKTAEKNSKVAIKTAKESQRMAEKAAKASAKAAQKTAKAAKSAGSAVAKTAIASLKAIVAGFAKLIAAIAAGGWVVLIIIIIFAVVAMIVTSCFGLFAGWNDRPELREIIQSINEEYNQQIEDIQNSKIYDEIELIDTHASWKDVLAVYSVVLTTDKENPRDVATMDDEKEALLASYFWSMHTITDSERIDTIKEKVEVEDEKGGTKEVEEERQVTILTIKVIHKTAWDMANELHFTEEQRQMLEQMLSPENNSMWLQLLYGIRTGDSNIVAVALSQIGNKGGDPYWQWYGFKERVSWCHAFVCWCADQCGYIESGIIPMTAYCPDGMDWFIAKNQWLDGSAEPTAGMIIYFDWTPRDGFADHVGIVEKVENGVVYTIEGNANDMCLELTYNVGEACILGYGVPAYN